jgi:hypothetical protein
MTHPCEPQTLPGGANARPHRYGWVFRREVTLGHMLQLVAMVMVLLAGWNNLQQQLAIIQHDLVRLIADQREFRLDLRQLEQRSGEQEYRLRRLEDASPAQLTMPAGDVAGGRANLQRRSEDEYANYLLYRDGVGAARAGGRLRPAPLCPGRGAETERLAS